MEKSDSRLLIFHVDMNFVSLREDYLRKWLKKVAEMDYNAVLWEIEDKIALETCSECIYPEAMSKDKFREILQYSRDLGLEPIPLLQTIGHGEYILLNEKYKHFREDPEYHDCYCTSNPEVRDFLKKLIEEYLDLFGDIKYFHIGGDEAYVFASCPKCKEKVEKIGKNGLYNEHITDISGPILQKNVRPGIWGDMILSHPENLQDISRDFIIWDWNYSDSDQSPQMLRLWGRKQRLTDPKNIPEDVKENFPELTDDQDNFRPFYTSDALKRNGFEVILCSASRSGGDSVYCARHDLHARNIVGAARKTVKSDLLGNLVTSWAIRINNYETQAACLNLASLTYKNPDADFEELAEKSTLKTFGLSDYKIFETLEKISTAYFFAVSSATGIQWNRLKDSLPAPKDFLRNYLDKWTEKPEFSPEVLKEKLMEAIKNISQGVEELYQLIPKAPEGKEYLREWAIAAYHQICRAGLAKAILDEKFDSVKCDKEKTVELAKNLKSEYQNWLETWETPQSAQKNAGLVFDALINYFI